MRDRRGRLTLVRLGATYIQIDAPHYPLLLDPGTRTFYESRGWPLDKWLSFGIELDNALMADFPEVTFGKSSHTPLPFDQPVLVALK